MMTRSLGAFRAPTSSWRPSGALRASWLCPSRPSAAQIVWPTQKNQTFSGDIEVRLSVIMLLQASNKSSWPCFEKYSTSRSDPYFCDRAGEGAAVGIAYSRSWMFFNLLTLYKAWVNDILSDRVWNIHYREEEEAKLFPRIPQLKYGIVYSIYVFFFSK